MVLKPVLVPNPYTPFLQNGYLRFLFRYFRSIYGPNFKRLCHKSIVRETNSSIIVVKLVVIRTTACLILPVRLEKSNRNYFRVSTCTFRGSTSAIFVMTVSLQNEGGAPVSQWDKPWLTDLAVPLEAKSVPL